MQICCIIKPPQFFDRRAILAELQRTKLLLLTTKILNYTPSLIATLYDHMDDAARAAIAERYSGMPGYALLLSAPNIDVCLEIVGRESDPCKCARHSLRYLYGWHSAPAAVGDWQWWENAVHRPVNERERTRDIALVFPRSSITS